MRRRVPLLIPFLAVAFSFGTACAAPVVRPPGDARRTCYQAEAPYAQIPCAKTGEGGAHSRQPRTFTDNGDGSVTDSTTGLTWQKEDDGNTYSWFLATGTADEIFNPTAINVCGSFGRVPSKEELMSLADTTIAYPGPTIHPVFTKTKSSGYWSSTTDEKRPGRAWLVGFTRHNFFIGGKDLPYYVRCVRGGQ